MPRRRRSHAPAIALFVLAALVVFAVLAGPTLMRKYGDSWFSSARCGVDLDEATFTLTAEQAENAALIAAVALADGLPHHAVTVALATAIQESDLRNIAFGDRDSLGLFQQRPSQGWGSAEQLLDRHYAARAFYAELVRVEGWEKLPVTEAAQAVQRSGHPSAYADHEDEARAWARVLTGEVPVAALTCTSGLPEVVATSAEDFAARAESDFDAGVEVRVAAAGGGGASVILTPGPAISPDAVAAWSVVASASAPVLSVATCDLEWTREGGQWSDADPVGMPCAGTVLTTIASPSAT